MALKTAALTIDRGGLPQQSVDLGVRSERQVSPDIKGASIDKVLIRPAGKLLSEEHAIGPEPRWNHILCGTWLQARAGTVAEGAGQLVVTGQRMIGMIESGTASRAPPLALNSSGNVFCFTFHHDDVYAPEMKKCRLKPSDFFFRSKEGQTLGFQFLFFNAMIAVPNGKTNYWLDKSMTFMMSAEGRQGLLRA